MRIASLALTLSTLVLTACMAGGPDYKNMRGYGQGSGKRIDGRTLGGYANPSDVAATDIAFSRAARDHGQWTAFRRFAADGAVIHGKNGVTEADPWLAAQADPPASVQWTPVSVWSSCDGSMAVTRGKFVEPGGQWGYYATVWKRQRDGRYRWVYDMGAPDDELTASENARKDMRPTEGNSIVIEAIETIEGRVADCLDRDELPPPEILTAMHGQKNGLLSSADRTLKATSTHFENGRRALSVSLARRDGWETVSVIEVDPGGKHIPQS